VQQADDVLVLARTEGQPHGEEWEATEATPDGALAGASGNRLTTDEARRLSDRRAQRFGGQLFSDSARLIRQDRDSR
jgi:hypothetical protein